MTITAFGWPLSMSWLSEPATCWQPESPILRKALEKIRQAGLAAGKSAWIMGDGPTNLALGFKFLCLGEVTSLMAGAMAAADRAVKDAPVDKTGVRKKS